MGRPKIEKEGKKTINLGIVIDKELNIHIEKFLEGKNITKRRFVEELICRELGIKFIPGHYAPATHKPNSDLGTLRGLQ